MYYVYELKYPETNIPFYVGKGKDRRAKYHTMRNKKGFYTENRYKDNVIRQILATGTDPVIEYVFYSENENVAYDYEESLIKKYGRKLFEDYGILTNICESSRPPHAEYTPERREKYRQNMIGNRLALGRVQTPNEKERRKYSLQHAYDSGRRVVTDKMREASRKTHTGKIVSDTTRQKQSVIATNRPPRSLESIEKGINTRKQNGALPPNRRCVTINGVVYQSIRDAARDLGISEYKAKLADDNKQ